MKSQYRLVLLIVSGTLLSGCTSTLPPTVMPAMVPASSTVDYSPTIASTTAPLGRSTTPDQGLPAGVSQLQPGIYTTSEASALSLPTSGYVVYVFGESHGEHEVRRLFLDYLKRLQTASGLRDIVLEEGQGYERDANAYVQGLTDTLRIDLCLRTDVLQGVRALNEQLPADQKIRVHLVDIDSPLEPIYAHLRALQSQIDPAAQPAEIPAWDKFQALSSPAALKLVDQLMLTARNQSAVINGLETVRASLRYYFAGNRIGAIAPTAGSSFNATIREPAIANNMQYLVKELNGAPVLALYGASHAQKRQSAFGAPAPDFKDWTQVLLESGVNLYSISVWGISGQAFWRGSASPVDSPAASIKFPDGTTLKAVIDAAPNDNVIYVDLRLDANAVVRLGYPYKDDTPASKIYDGLVLFKKVTPMENMCSK